MSNATDPDLLNDCTPPDEQAGAPYVIPEHIKKLMDANKIVPHRGSLENDDIEWLVCLKCRENPPAEGSDSFCRQCKKEFLEMIEKGEQ